MVCTTNFNDNRVHSGEHSRNGNSANHPAADAEPLNGHIHEPGTNGDQRHNSTKPKPLPVVPESIPEAMREHRSWVLWRYEWSAKKGDWDKPPYDPNKFFEIVPNAEKHASSTDRKTWGSYGACLTIYQNHGGEIDGIVRGQVIIHVRGHQVLRAEPRFS